MNEVLQNLQHLISNSIVFSAVKIRIVCNKSFFLRFIRFKSLFKNCIFSIIDS